MSFLPSALRLQLVQVLATARRSLGMRRGSGIVSRFLYPELIRDREPIITIVKYDENLRISIDTRSLIEWSIYINGYYEPVSIRAFNSIIRKGDVVIDAGANVGALTLVLSRLVGSEGMVLAIEPNVVVLEKLHRNLDLNPTIENVRVLPVAVSDEKGEAQLYDGQNSSNEGLGRLWTEQQAEEKESQPITVQTLDAILEENRITRVRLLKLDIQGWEYKALLGGKNMLQTFQPYIMFEVDYNAKFAGAELSNIRNFLNLYAYSLYQIHANGEIIICNSNNVTGDFLAVPSAHVAPSKV